MKSSTNPEAPDPVVWPRKSLGEKSAINWNIRADSTIA